MPTLSVSFTDAEYAMLVAWRARYADRMGVAADRVTWGQLLTAYANSTVGP